VSGRHVLSWERGGIYTGGDKREWRIGVGW
jgi:hypothetical protein